MKWWLYEGLIDFQKLNFTRIEGEGCIVILRPLITQ